MFRGVSREAKEKVFIAITMEEAKAPQAKNESATAIAHICLVEEAEFWKSKAACDEATPDKVWLALNCHVRQGRMTEAEQRALVWDVFAGDKHTELRTMCPYFDPEHEVWSDSELAHSERAMAELSRIMADEGEFGVQQFQQCMLVGSYISYLAVMCWLYYRLFSGHRDRWGFFLLSALMSAAFEWYHAADGAFAKISPLNVFPTKSYAPVMRYSGQEKAPLSSLELQYSKSWAATHNWRLRIELHYVSPDYVWARLDKLVGGPITSFERLRIFKGSVPWSSEEIDSNPIFHGDLSLCNIKKAERDFEVLVAALANQPTPFKLLAVGLPGIGMPALPLACAVLAVFALKPQNIVDWCPHALNLIESCRHLRLQFTNAHAYLRAMVKKRQSMRGVPRKYEA